MNETINSVDLEEEATDQEQIFIHENGEEEVGYNG